MADLDKILESFPDLQTEDFPLHDIMNLPGMSPDSVIPYHLYLTTNKRLPEERKEKVREIIQRIRFNADYYNKRNMAYLNRDFDETYAREYENQDK